MSSPRNRALFLVFLVAAAAGCSSDAQTDNETSDVADGVTANDAQTDNESSDVVDGVVANDGTFQGDGVESDGAAGDAATQDTSPASGSLELLSDAEIWVSFGDEATLSVRLLDSAGEPVAAGAVCFDPVGEVSGSTMSARSVLSASDGTAESVVQAGVQLAEFDVIIIACDDDTVEAKVVTVHVQVEPTLEYEIRLSYDGDHELHTAYVALLTAEAECTALAEQEADWDIEVHPTVDGTFAERPLNRAVDNPIRSAAAWATERDGATELEQVAFGCVATIPDPSADEVNVIEIELHDL